MRIQDPARVEGPPPLFRIACQKFRVLIIGDTGGRNCQSYVRWLPSRPALTPVDACVSSEQRGECPGPGAACGTDAFAR